MSCNNSLFTELMDFLLSELSRNSSTSTTRTYIQCIGAIRYMAQHAENTGLHIYVIAWCDLEFIKWYKGGFVQEFSFVQLIC